MTALEHAILGLRFLRLDSQALMLDGYSAHKLEAIIQAESAVRGYWELAIQLERWDIADAASMVSKLLWTALIEEMRVKEVEARRAS